MNKSTHKSYHLQIFHNLALWVTRSSNKPAYNKNLVPNIFHNFNRSLQPSPVNQWDLVMLVSESMSLQQPHSHSSLPWPEPASQCSFYCRSACFESFVFIAFYSIYTWNKWATIFNRPVCILTFSGKLFPVLNPYLSLLNVTIDWSYSCRLPWSNSSTPVHSFCSYSLQSWTW